MAQKDGKIKAEETLVFMMTLTFIGGYLNAYSYFTRGGAFVSMHTGNITKIGIAALTRDMDMFVACIVPICGAMLGSIIAQVLKVRFSRRSVLFWQKSALLAELFALLAVGLLPDTLPNNGVNFLLSVVATFQLSNFRKFEGAVHNTTIETGNLRTLGQYFTDLLLKRDAASGRLFFRYFALVFSFPVGVFAGGFLSLRLGVPAIWGSCALLALLTFVCLPRKEAAAQ